MRYLEFSRFLRNQLEARGITIRQLSFACDDKIPTRRFYDFAEGVRVPQGLELALMTQLYKRPSGFYRAGLEEDTIMNPYELLTEEQWRLRTEWAERRSENDNQAIIHLQNLALFTAFTICEGGK